MEDSIMFIDEDAKLAVKKGAAWLDENHPDWMHHINLSELRMNVCNACVIGQAVGNYYAVINVAAGYPERGSASMQEESRHWAVEHGFQTPGFTAPNGDWDTIRNSDYYRGIETLWSTEVTNRLGALTS